MYLPTMLHVTMFVARYWIPSFRPSSQTALFRIRVLYPGRSALHHFHMQNHTLQKEQVCKNHDIAIAIAS